MKIKNLIALLLFPTILCAQKLTVKNYFIPDAPNNKALFEGIIEKVIFYKPLGNKYELTSANAVGGQVTSGQTISIVITPNEVKMIKSVVSSTIQAKKTKIFPQPITILKLPSANQTLSWTSKSPLGEVENCKASLVEMDVDGKKVKAIKLVKIPNGLKIQTIEYYVEGYGLYKSELYHPTSKETQQTNILYSLRESK